MSDNKQNTEPESTNESTNKWKPIRMPWLHLLDPITGELPKNYEDILAKEKEAKTHPSVKKIKPQRINLKDLLDPDADKLPNGKNVYATKKVLSGGLNTNRPSTSSIGNGGLKQRNLYSNFKVSTYISGKGSATIADQPLTNIKGRDTGIRKKLFSESPKQKKTSVSGTKNGGKKIVKIQNCQVNIQPQTSSTTDYTEGFLEMSLAESEVTNSRTKSNGESLDLRNELDPPSDVHSSGSSTNEFLELEQQCRTPKRKFSLSDTSCNCNQSDYYIRKVSNIIEKLTELLHESNDVLDHLKNCKNMNNKGSNKRCRSSSSVDRGANKNKENCALPSKAVSSILTSTKKKKKDLRINTLKKMVTFNEGNTNKPNNVDKALDLYNTVRAATRSVLGTPKIINNLTPLQNGNLSKTVHDQCLLLQHTPKRF